MNDIVKLTGTMFSVPGRYDSHIYREYAARACAEKLARHLLVAAHGTPLIFQTHTQTRDEGDRTRHEHSALIMPFQTWTFRNLIFTKNNPPFDITEAPVYAREVIWRIPSPFSEETIFVKANTFEVKK